jgi:hypothetical protein
MVGGGRRGSLFVVPALLRWLLFDCTYENNSTEVPQQIERVRKAARSGEGTQKIRRQQQAGTNLLRSTVEGRPAGAADRSTSSCKEIVLRNYVRLSTM